MCLYVCRIVFSMHFCSTIANRIINLLFDKFNLMFFFIRGMGIFFPLPWHVLFFSYSDIPRASLRPGHSLDLSAIEEGDDVYFECTVDSSPTFYKIVWLHQVHWSLYIFAIENTFILICSLRITQKTITIAIQSSTLSIFFSGEIKSMKTKCPFALFQSFYLHISNEIKITFFKESVADTYIPILPTFVSAVVCMSSSSCITKSLIN